MRYVAVSKVDNNILLGGDSCCTSLYELYTALTDSNTTEIEIRKEFADKFFTYTALNEFVSYSAAIFPNIRIIVEDTLCDTDTENVENLKAFRTPSELIYALHRNPSKIISTINMLCDRYLEDREESSILNNKMASMSVRIGDLNTQLKRILEEKEKLQEINNDLYSKLHALVSRTNFRYEKTIEPDTMFISSTNNYNHILYIKEITRVHYTDTLLYYLCEILKTLYEVPARMVVIEPYYSYGRERMYSLFKPHWDLKYKNVYSGNIMMAGYQPHLMEDILQNASHVNYLIVLDRGGYQVPHISSSNVTYVYTVSDKSDLDIAIDDKHVISYDDSTLYIPYIEDFESLSSESKVQKYSSMSVTKALITYLEEAIK